MKSEMLLSAIGDIKEEFIEEAKPTGKNRARLIRSIAAACIVLMVACSAVIMSIQKPASPADGELMPHVIVEDEVYFISPWSSPWIEISETVPEGFSEMGTVEVEGYGKCPYYKNENIPYWVYVYHEVRTNGEVDETGSLINTEPHKAYVRYVREDVRGKDFVFAEGKLYESMWSADYENPLFEETKNDIGIRIEGEAPNGYKYLGECLFSGYDTVPVEGLSSNTGNEKVYISQDGKILLVETSWYTHTEEENEETLHAGYNVYILSDME